MRIQARFENSTPMSVKNVKRTVTTTSIFSFLFICIFLLGLNQSLSAKISSYNCETNSRYMDDTGGFVVVISGLIDESIVLEFDSSSGLKTTSKNDEFNTTIFAEDGSLVYELNSESPFLDFKGISLPAGTYTLVVTVGNASQSVIFNPS